MSKGETLRVLVTERLTAAAGDIYALFERTIAEYEEELRRSQRENERKQRLLDAVLNPRVVLQRGGVGVQVPSPRPGPSLRQRSSVQIKEEPREQSIVYKEQQLQTIVPELNSVYVKTEEPFPLREETPEEGITSEQHFHSESEGDSDDSSSTDSDDSSSCSDSDDDCSNSDTDGEVDFSWYGAPMETEADGDVHVQNSGLMPPGTKIKKYQCSFCGEKFKSIRGLKSHTSKLHLEKSCPLCVKRNHKNMTHTTHENQHYNIDKPYSCPMCCKLFAQLGQLESHLRVHTGERPYSCSFCNKSYTQKYTLNAHMKSHTAGPFRCSKCNKSFPAKWNLTLHMRTHKKK